MSKTKISWTEYNWNPFTGCTALSPGCVNCYARKNARRLKGNPFTDKYKDEFQFRFHPEYLDKPLHWKKPRKIFVNTMSDTFHEDAPLEAIQQIFERMVKCPQHIFQVLTKRAERMAKLSAELHWPYNVWAGVTIENADYLGRLDFLRKVPAKVRFISFEPLLSAIPNINFQDIHWAIVGGESGPKARPMDLDWARDIREQCGKAGVPFFFKQVGGEGRDKGGRLLDGKEWNEYPDTNDTAAPESDAADVDGQSSFAEQRGLRPLRDVEKPPIIEHFDRKNPHPTLKKTRKKEADEMPKHTKSEAGAEENTVKKSSDDEQQVLPEKEEDSTPVQTGGAVDMVDKAQFDAIVDELRQRKTIKDDKGKEINFTDALKTSLVNDVESAYTVLTAALGNIYDTGKFMYDVRKRQKKHRLWMSFQEIIGLRKSATNNYIRIYERFGDRLRKYGHLGVSKLQDVARLKDPFTFIEAHKEKIEKGDVRSVTKMVRAEVDAKRTKKSKRAPQHLEVGSFRIKLATNGRVLTIQGLNREMQNKLVEYLKGFVSQAK